MRLPPPLSQDVASEGCARQCKTSRFGEARASKFPEREEDYSGPSESRKVNQRKEKLKYEYVHSKPSLWNDHAFNEVEFYDRHFSFPENFPGDYQSFINMSSTGLSDILEVQLLRCLLVGQAQREKYSKTNRGLQSKVIHVNRSIHEGGTTMRLLREK